jgi:phage shock protein PspC (stress-responsive transcriptional regulator)
MTDLRKSDNGGAASNGFRLDKPNGKLMGVCSGIARRFGIDATLLRIGFVASVLLGFGFPVLVYLAIGLIAD